MNILKIFCVKQRLTKSDNIEILFYIIDKTFISIYIRVNLLT